MKKRSKFNHLSALVLLAAAPNSYAVLSFLNPTWVGDGTPAAPPSPGTYVNGGAGIFGSFATGVSSGTLNHGALLETPGNRLINPVTASSTITVNGGVGATADLTLGNTTAFDGSSTQWNNFTLNNFSAQVTSFSITVAASDYLAGRTVTSGNIQAGPILAALGLLNDGGAGISGFDVTATYGGVFSSSVVADPTMGTFAQTGFVAGAGEVGPASASSAFGATIAGQTSFATTNGFTGPVNQGSGGLSGPFLLVQGYDAQNDGFSGADVSNLYADTVTFTVTPDAGSFGAGTEFVVSLDGRQYPGVDNVPEPSSAALLALVGLGVLARRKR